jgi:hypothetical protein
VPGLSRSVEPRIDRFGEVATRDGGPLRRAGTNSASCRSVYRLELPAGRSLTREQETELKQRRGRAVRGALERLMSDPRYSRIDDAVRINAIDRLLSRVRSQMSQSLRRE